MQAGFIFPKIYFTCNLTHFEGENFLIPLSITFLNPKILGYLFSKPGENNVKNLTSENRRKLIRKASHCT